MDLGPEWAELDLEKKELELKIREIDKKCKVIAAREFAKFLQGKWKYDDYDLTPADRDAENALVNLLSYALNLNYHDSFVIESGEISIYARVDDGSLRLSLDINNKASYERALADLRVINLDVDIKGFFLEQYKDNLLHQEYDCKKAQEKIDKLKINIAALENE